MMSKATRKLILKKELLRTLDEGDLRVVNGGKPEPSYAAACAYDTRPFPCDSLLQQPILV
jgi:hypothetical protein